MKRNILKTTALFIVLSGLLFSCTLFEDDSSSEIVTAVTTKTEAAKKAVLSLSVAGEEASRTALPSVSSAQEFESFDFKANNGAASITKSWTGDSEKTAYTKMTSESFEIDAGIWTLTLTAKKGGMTYTGTLNKELVAGANSIEFTLALSELSNEGKGSVEIKLSVPQCVVAVTATLCDTSENEVSDSSIMQSTDLANNIVNYSAQNVPSETYLVVFNLYADSEKTLLLEKWREYVGITYGATSKSEITIAADDLDKVYTITYELNGGTLKGNWAGSYTRRMNFPTQRDLVNNEGLKFEGWYTDENFNNEFNYASLTGNLILYAKWKTITVDELIESIKNKSISDKAALVGEITSERLSEIVAAMNEAECYLALDLSMTKGLSSIGNEFKNCQYLTGISIPKTVTSIGAGAFSGCSGLTEMTIPFVGESVSATGKSSLFGYIFGNSSYTGGTATQMYYSSSSSARYYIPSSLKTVTVVDGKLKYGAFYGCSGLESVMIPSSVTSIGEGAFSGCSGLTSVMIPSSVTRIGADAFGGCSGLESVTIPSSVTSIGYSAFSGCSGLTEMTIPFVGESVSATGEASIFGYIFGNSSYTGGTATKMYYMYYSSSHSATYYIPGSLKTVTVLGGELKYGAFSGCSGLESVTIPSSVTSIGECAFNGCSGLTSVTIPNSVTSIGKYAFSWCSGLVSLMIPSSVTSIGEDAFNGCSGLTEMTIPFVGRSASSTEGFKEIFGGYISSVTLSEGMTSIKRYAFDGCSGLESVTIPSSVTSIGVCAFRDCSGLKSVYYDGTLEQWLAIVFDDESNPCCHGSDLYIQGNKITDLVIPEGVTSIGKYAFDGCSGLESVAIPSSVTSIKHYAFRGCSGLKSVTIPSSVTSIWDYAFRGCSGLKSVTIPGSVTSMGIEAFSWCSGLESVTLSEGLRSIGERAFWGCSGLESVTIPSSVTSIRQYAFDGCSKLTSLTCLGKNRWNVGGHTGISITVSKVRDKYLDMDWTREQSGGGSTQIGNVSNLRCTYLNMTKGSRKIILTWSGEATSLSFKFNGYTVNQKNVDFSANKVTLYEKDGDEDEKRYSVYCPNLGNSNRFVFIVDSESINVNF